MNKYLTPLENKALAITVELWNTLLELPVQHEQDVQEHCRDIHNIQNRILARLAKELEPSKEV